MKISEKTREIVRDIRFKNAFGLARVVIPVFTKQQQAFWAEVLLREDVDAEVVLQELA